MLRRSAPLPQLLPDLDESLHLSRAWEPAIDQPAIPVRLFIEVSNCSQAKVSEVVTQFVKVRLAQHFGLFAIRTPSHAKKMLPYSLFVRLQKCWPVWPAKQVLCNSDHFYGCLKARVSSYPRDLRSTMQQPRKPMSKHDTVTKRKRRPKSDKRVDYTARTMAVLRKLSQAAKASEAERSSQKSA